MVAGSKTALRNFLGQQSLSLRIAQYKNGGQSLSINVHFLRGRESLPSQDCAMLVLVRQTLGQGCLDPRPTTESECECECMEILSVNMSE